MTWVRLDDRLFLNPKLTAVSLEAVAVYTLGLTYAAHNETDGILPGHALHLIRCTPEIALELQRAALWERVDELDEYEINDFLEFNPSRDELEKQRAALSAKRSEAGKRGALARWSAMREDMATSAPGPGSMATPMANGSQPDSPVPVPVPEELPIDSGVSRCARVVARFNEHRAAGKNIDVDARLIGRALEDHKHLSDLEQHANDCAAWIGEHAPPRNAKPRVAHLTLRTWLRKEAARLPTKGLPDGQSNSRIRNRPAAAP